MSEMLPKELLTDLEKGDRTKEFLTKKETTYGGGGFGVVDDPLNQLAQLQRLANRQGDTVTFNGFNSPQMFGMSASIGGWFNGQR